MTGPTRRFLAIRRLPALLGISLFALCGCLAAAWDVDARWLRSLRPALETYSLPVLSAALLGNILFQVHRSLREVFCRRELPPSEGGAVCAEAYRFRRVGTAGELLPDLLAGLDRRFGRIYAFQEFRSPQLYFHWFAKKGALSLLALPWIKAGFLPLFLLCQFHLSCNGRIPVDAAAWWLLTVLAAFWVPGILLCLLRPYQKCWLTLADQANVVYLQIARTSPFRLEKWRCRCLPAMESAPPG